MGANYFEVDVNSAGHDWVQVTISGDQAHNLDPIDIQAYLNLGYEVKKFMGTLNSPRKAVIFSELDAEYLRDLKETKWGEISGSKNSDHEMKQGYLAFFTEGEGAKNPYPLKTRQWQEWELGWLAARKKGME